MSIYALFLNGTTDRGRCLKARGHTMTGVEREPGTGVEGGPAAEPLVGGRGDVRIVIN